MAVTTTTHQVQETVEIDESANAVHGTVAAELTQTQTETVDVLRGNVAETAVTTLIPMTA